MRHIETNLALLMANALYASAGIYGGASFNREFERPTSGYMVSVMEMKKYDNLSDVNTHELSGKIGQLLESIGDATDKFFGSWKDQDGAVYFDLSVNVDCLSGARILGEKNNQIAIWDVANNCEIRL